jgi:hypothetical protein
MRTVIAKLSTLRWTCGICGCWVDDRAKTCPIKH